VRNFARVLPVLERMAEIGLPLCVHGEVVDAEVDVFDRESVFIERVLDPILRAIPDLKVVMEHITTRDGIDYARSRENLGATITVHHLILNRNRILGNGIRPHYYCLPVAKREEHRLALRAAAVSGDPSFFLGTDSAPHTDPAKESAQGCAGCFTALNAMQILAQVFDDEDALDRLESFVSLNGAAFYGLPANERTLTLERGKPAVWPRKIETGDGPVTVFNPDIPIYWHVKE